MTNPSRPSGKPAVPPPQGGRTPQQQRGVEIAERLAKRKAFGLDPFELFCAYHLGITEEGTYRFQNVHDVAKRFGVQPAEVRQALSEYGMDSDAVINSSFNMAVAQVDIQVSPSGVDLRTLAQMHFEDFLGAPRKARNWQKELAADEEANAETYGRKSRP